MQIKNVYIFFSFILFFILLLHLFSISGGLVYAYLTFRNISTSSPHTTNQAAEELGHVIEEPYNVSVKRPV